MSEIKTISDLKKEVDYAQAETYCNGETIASHNYPSSVAVYCESLDKWFYIASVELNHNGGCGCPYGIILEITEDT